MDDVQYSGHLDGVLDPRQHDNLVGHDKQKHAILNAFEKDRFPQAWLLQGPSGIGKATFAWHFARRLAELGNPSIETLDQALIEKYARGSQAKIIDISLLQDEKGKLKTQISVDQIRSLTEKLSLTGEAGEWRVVIIDPADAMNNAAANALLKLLEEPPSKVVFFLVTDAPYRLLPTIHSRCQSIRFHELTMNEIREIWSLVSEMTIANETRLNLAEGSIRRAFEMDDEISAYYLDMVKTILSGADEASVSRLSRALTKGTRAEDIARAKLLFHLLFGRLARIGAGLASGDANEERAANSLVQILPQWASLSQIILQNLDDAARLNLDAEVTIVTQWLAIQNLLRSS